MWQLGQGLLLAQGSFPFPIPFRYIERKEEGVTMSLTWPFSSKRPHTRGQPLGPCGLKNTTYRQVQFTLNDERSTRVQMLCVC